MAKVTIYDMTGKSVGERELNDAIFAVTPNKAVLHEVVKNYLANQRQGTQSTLTRQGSTRAPQWTHGGVALGPKPRSYRYSINRKMKVVGLKSALSAKVAEGELILVDAIKVDEYKTKTVVNMLKALGAEGKALIVTDTVNKTLVGSASNIPGVKTSIVGEMNTYDVLNSRKTILTVAAVDKLEEVYAK